MSLITPVIHRWIQDGLRDPEEFWARAARDVSWFRPWDRVFEWTFPTFRWFLGAETNLAYNALDRHVAAGRGGHAALASINERGDRLVVTYAQLLHDVRHLAAALRGLGIGKGDRLTIYMPPCRESVALMLATVRIGAIHSVVFAGFGAKALADRIRASGSRVIFTADVTFRKGKNVQLKQIVDEAIEAIDREADASSDSRSLSDAASGSRAASGVASGSRPASAVASGFSRTIDHEISDVASGFSRTIDHVIVLQRTDVAAPMRRDRDLSWDQFLTRTGAQDSTAVRMESNEPAFILATSGTTAKPKLAIHTHGGYQVHITSMGRWCFGLKPEDVWWATSDIGWIVGHSYMIYAPLLAGCTSVVFEGALDHPQPDSNWRVAVEELGVTGIFTSPTAIRTLMKYGDEPLKGIDHGRLERVVCAGEVLNPAALEWLQHTILDDRVPVIDHMWQTETGGPVFGNPYGIGMLPIKPGSATVALPGIEAEVVNPDGTPCATGEKGIMVFKRPFPGLTPALWGEPERYGRDYWERIPHVYYTGDSAHVDQDGYVWFAGRSDEIIKIAGHRIGTIEVESAFLKHASVAECGVIGRPDETRGEVISAFILLKHGHSPSQALKAELLQTVRREMGPVAVIGELNFVTLLPKTRSGKIMRRVLRAVTLDRDPGDITTIEEEGSVDEARHAWRQMKDDLASDSRAADQP